MFTPPHVFRTCAVAETDAATGYNCARRTSTNVRARAPWRPRAVMRRAKPATGSLLPLELLRRAGARARVLRRTSIRCYEPPSNAARADRGGRQRHGPRAVRLWSSSRVLAWCLWLCHPYRSGFAVYTRLRRLSSVLSRSPRRAPRPSRPPVPSVTRPKVPSRFRPSGRHKLRSPAGLRSPIGLGPRRRERYTSHPTYHRDGRPGPALA